MIIHAGEIRKCLDKAKEIAELYDLYVKAPDTSIKSVDDLEWICREYLEKSIVIETLEDLQVHRDGVPPELWGIRGFYLSHGNDYAVYVLGGQNYCWNRFVRTKELFHMLLDEEEYQTTELYDHIKEVSVKFLEENGRPGRSAVSEIMAEIAAMEFLFPMNNRLNEASRKEVDYASIAEHHKIPQFYVEKYMSDEIIETLTSFLPSAS